MPAKPQMRMIQDYAVEPGGRGGGNTLQYKGRPVVEVAGLAVEAQFALADQSALVLVADHTLYKEMLTISLIGPNLQERDRVLVGGAYPSGFLAYAEPRGADELAFAWHDLDLAVRVRRYWSWMGMRRRWLLLRDTVPDLEARARAATG